MTDSVAYILQHLERPEDKSAGFQKGKRNGCFVEEVDLGGKPLETLVKSVRLRTGFKVTPEDVWYLGEYNEDLKGTHKVHLYTVPVSDLTAVNKKVNTRANIKWTHPQHAFLTGDWRCITLIALAIIHLADNSVVEFVDKDGETVADAKGMIL